MSVDIPLQAFEALLHSPNVPTVCRALNMYQVAAAYTRLSGGNPLEPLAADVRQVALEIISRFTKQPESVFESWVLVPGKDYYRDQNGVPDLDMVTANIRVERELGLVKEDLDAKQYADLAPLKEALAGLK